MARTQDGACLIAFTLKYPCVCDVWAIMRLAAAAGNWSACKHALNVYLEAMTRKWSHQIVELNFVTS